MKLKNLALNSVVYFLYILGACLITMLVEALLVDILVKFVVLAYPVLTGIRMILYTGGVVAILAVLGRAEGYREETCSIPETVVSGLLAMVIHLIFSILFHFQAFISGPVRFSAGLLHHGKHITPDLLSNATPFGLFLLSFLAYGLLYTVILTVSRYVGAKARIIRRAETILAPSGEEGKN